MKLHSKRLLAVGECIKKYKRGNILADIGTDHAYLPCFLLKENIITMAYACDVAQGPLLNSQATIKQEKLEEKVQALLGDGLDPVANKPVDMISICGMGGLLMTQILEAHPEKLKESLFFLQANTAIDLLREYLLTHHMKIIDECIVEDGHHIYEIIVTSWGEQDYNEEDVYFGPCLRRKRDPLFIKKWQRQYEQEINILTHLPTTHEQYQQHQKIKEKIEKVLS